MLIEEIMEIIRREWRTKQYEGPWVVGERGWPDRQPQEQIELPI